MGSMIRFQGGEAFFLKALVSNVRSGSIDQCRWTAYPFNKTMKGRKG
jgi:hypothetical protein